jgi:hypothetical protein
MKHLPRNIYPRLRRAQRRFTRLKWFQEPDCMSEISRLLRQFEPDLAPALRIQQERRLRQIASRPRRVQHLRSPKTTTARRSATLVVRLEMERPEYLIGIAIVSLGQALDRMQQTLVAVDEPCHGLKETRDLITDAVKNVTCDTQNGTPDCRREGRPSRQHL